MGEIYPLEFEEFTFEAEGGSSEAAPAMGK